jgi:hypothetical protein
VSEYALKLLDEEGTRGPFSADELRDALERYRSEHPDDEAFGRVHMWEMRPGSSVGIPRSVFDFVDER